MLPPSTSPTATGRSGCRRPERAKNTTSATMAIVVRAITTLVASEKRPNAMPVLRTRWIDSGPRALDRVPELERPGDDQLRQLVRRGRGARDHEERRPLGRTGGEGALCSRDRLEGVRCGADADLEGGT